MKILCLLFLMATPAWAQEFLQTPEAMFLQLDTAGFKPLSQRIFNEALEDISRKPMRDYKKKISGVDVSVSGSHYSVDFERLDIKPRQGLLWARVDIKSASVFADKIRMKKKVIGIPISSTCRSTTITISGKDNLHVEAEFKVTVNKRRIDVQAHNVQFKVREDQYKVKGPKKCSGELGVGSLIKSVVRDALKRAREDIAKQVRQQVEKTAKEVAKQLNDATHLEFEHVVEGMPPVPNTKISLKTFPQIVQLHPSYARFIFELSAQVEPQKEKSWWAALSAWQSRRSTPEVLGSIGINPAFVNELLAKIVQRFPAGIELDPSAVRGLNKVLNVQTLSAVWPDLLSLEPDSKAIKIFLHLEQAPQLDLADPRLTQENVQVLFRLPAVKLVFQAYKDGVWFDYFALDLGLDNLLNLNVLRQEFSLRYLQGAITQLSGDWAEDYQPTEEFVEWDVLESLLLVIFDYLYTQEDLMRFTMPTIRLLDQELAFYDSYTLNRKYLALTLTMP